MEGRLYYVFYYVNATKHERARNSSLGSLTPGFSKGSYTRNAYILYTNHAVAQRQGCPRIVVASNGAAIVTLPIGRPPESQAFIEINADSGSPCLYHHVGRDEFMVRTEFHMMLDPVEGQHQVQLIDRPEGSFVPSANLSTVIEIRQGIRAEATIVRHSSRYQKLRFVNISSISKQFIRKKYSHRQR